MNNYKPYSYLYKKTGANEKLISRFITQIPFGKKLTLKKNDPTTIGSKTLIRYAIEDDAGSAKTRKEEFENEITWDGRIHEVQITVGSGSGDDGGETVMSSADAELF